MAAAGFARRQGLLFASLRCGNRFETCIAFRVLIYMHMKANAEPDELNGYTARLVTYKAGYLHRMASELVCRHRLLTLRARAPKTTLFPSELMYQCYAA